MLPVLSVAASEGQGKLKDRNAMQCSQDFEEQGGKTQGRCFGHHYAALVAHGSIRRSCNHKSWVWRITLILSASGDDAQPGPTAYKGSKRQ